MAGTRDEEAAADEAGVDVSDLDVVVGANASVVGGKGDNVVYGEDGSVVVYAASVIEGVVVSEHRPCLLVVDGVQLRVLSVEREGKRHVYRCGPWAPGPFEREGAVVVYDPDRVREARVEQARWYLRLAVVIVLLPLFPIVAVLSHEQKEALRERGLLPVTTGATGSIYFEWIVMILVVVLELLCIMGGAVFFAVVCGALALAMLVDVQHRMVLAMENRDPGMLAWPRELWRALRDEPPKRLE